MRQFAGLLLTVLLAVGSAYAGTISTFNTGVDFNPITFTDLNYTLAFDASTPGAGVAGPAFFVDPSKFPISTGNWFADSTTSAWIGPGHDESTAEDPAGYYTYTTTFDLTGFNPTTASLTGQWSTDNPGIEILLNGNVFPFTTPDNAFNQGFFPYAINSGFSAGVNTIQWVASNTFCPPPSCGFNPTGFRNEYSVTASAIPEPSAILLLTTGLAGIIGLGWRKVFA